MLGDAEGGVAKRIIQQEQNAQYVTEREMLSWWGCENKQPKMLLHSHHLCMQYGKQLLPTVSSKLQPVCFYVTFFFRLLRMSHYIQSTLLLLLLLVVVHRHVAVALVIRDVKMVDS